VPADATTSSRVTQEYFLKIPPAPHKLPGFHVSSLRECESLTVPRSHYPDSNESLSAQKFRGCSRLASRSTHRDRGLGGPSMFRKVNILPDAFRPCGIRAREPGYARLTAQMYQGRREGVRRGEELRHRSVCFPFGSHHPTQIYPSLDNTNRDIQTRKFYLDVAKRLQVPARYGLQAWLISFHSYMLIICRCFSFQGSVELAWHNNLYRAFARPASVVAREVRKPLDATLLPDSPRCSPFVR
jgi:bifunctional polynucleotide phosphatase/kinase